MEYQWTALYRDGNSLKQFPGDGSESRYADIDRSRLTHFCVSTREDKARVLLVVHIPLDGRLIYRRRTEQWGNSAAQTRVVWLIGCQQTADGQNSQFLAALFPDEHIEVTDGFKEGHAWFYPVEPVPCEYADTAGN